MHMFFFSDSLFAPLPDKCRNRWLFYDCKFVGMQEVLVIRLSFGCQVDLRGQQNDVTLAQVVEYY